MKPDVNKPIENPKLSALLGKLHSASSLKQQELCEAIAAELAENARLLAVFQMNDDALEQHDDGTAVFKQDSKISFGFLRSTEGITFLPVYTDWKELKKCKAYADGSVKTLILSFDDMAAITRGERGIVVNPYSDNFILLPEDVAYMKQCRDHPAQATAWTVGADTPVQLSDPADPPTEMIEAISRFARQTKEIKTIWLKLMDRDGEKSFLLVVEAKGDEAQINQGIANAASPHLAQGMYLDLVSYAASFGRQAATGTPIYRRKKKK